MANNNTALNNEVDALILSDSLGRNVPYMYNTDKLFFPGCTIGALTNKIETGEVQIVKYNYIIILIGTNDLGPKDVWSFYRSEIRKGRSGRNLPYHNPTAIPVLASLYHKLIATIKGLNPSIRLAFLGLLPRPYDHHRNKQHHVDANYVLKQECDQTNTTFVPTFRSFLKYGKPVDELFIDGLHPSPKGVLQLYEIISYTINCFRSESQKTQ